jgi:peptidylprolyl isomerase
MLMRMRFITLPVLLLLIAAAPEIQPAERTTPSGLKIIEVDHQTEPLVTQANDFVGVHYTGKLQSNGQKFDSSFDHPNQEPIWFQLGAHRVIPGWDEGLLGMKIGDKRQLIIPPNLAYGERGTPGGPIPPNATLVFDVELVGVYRPQK